MSRPSRAAAPSVNLFPFLAVLLCMMGALVFLLVALANRVGVDPDEALIAITPVPVAEPLELPSPDVEPPRLKLPEPVVHDALVIEASSTQADVDGPLLVEIEALRRQRDQLRETQDDRDRRSREITDRIARLTEERRQLQLQSQEAGRVRNQAAERLDQSRDLLAAAVSKLAKLNDDLAEKAAQPRARTTKFRVLPYDRMTGTQRHPIVIECLDDGYRFAIEGVDVAANAFRGTTIESNPLIRGVNALASYYAKQGERPYVLLLVRPAGIDSFQIGRGILQRNRRDWGYELIPDGVALDWPARDAAAYDELVAAVNLPGTARPGSVVRGTPLHESGDVFGYAKQATREDKHLANHSLARRHGASAPGTNRGPELSTPAFGRGLGSRPPASTGSETARPPSRLTPSQSSANALASRPQSRVTLNGDAVAMQRGGAESSGDAAAFDSPTASEANARRSFGAGQQQSSQNASGSGYGTPVRRWGKQSMDQWIGYERRVEVRIEGNALTSGKASIDGLDQMTAETLSVAIADLLDVIAADWEPPKRRMFWRPTLVAQGQANRNDSKITAACEEIDVSFRREPIRTATSTSPQPSRSGRRTP